MSALSRRLNHRKAALHALSSRAKGIPNNEHAAEIIAIALKIQVVDTYALCESAVHILSGSENW